MSYCRNPYYIYPTGDGVSMNGEFIPDEVLDLWVYNMMLKCRREELTERVRHGKEVALSRIENPDFVNYITENDIDTENMTDEEFSTIFYLSKESPIVKLETEWHENNEDELTKNLLNG